MPITPSSSGGQVVKAARVRVVVRVRPLNPTEMSRGHKCTIQPSSDQAFTIWDPALFEFEAQGGFDDMDPTCWSRSFAFDDCLWSMDPKVGLIVTLTLALVLTLF